MDAQTAPEPTRHRSGDIYNERVEDIKITPGFNYRDLSTPYALAKIREMADTMLNPEVGFIQSKHLTVRRVKGEIWLIDGHRRMAAVALANSEGAGILTIPCGPEARGTNDLDRDYHLFSTGEPLTILEQATGVKRLMNRGQSFEQMSARLGVKIPVIKSWLELAEAPAEIVAAVEAGEIAGTEARKLVKVNGAKAEEVLAKAKTRANSEGRSKVRPRDVAAVSEPRTEPVSVHSLAIAAAQMFADGEADTVGFELAMEALCRKLGMME
jgi:ParB family transcriptional regulator, chromosome partitioning protein